MEQTTSQNLRNKMINSLLIKTVLKAVVKRRFFFAAPAAKFGKRDLRSASEKVFPGLCGNLFDAVLPQEKRRFNTQ